MKKTTLLLAFTFLFAINSFAQDHGYFAVSAGVGIPVGSLQSTQQSQNSSGYAKKGLTFDVSYNQKFGKTFGVLALVRAQSLPLNTQAFSDQLRQQNPGINFSIDGNSWKISEFMVGGFSTTPISPKFSFTPRLMIGILAATSPEMTVNVVTGGPPVWAKQNSSTSSAFCYLVGIGFKLDVGKRICLLANLDLVDSTVKFKDVESLSSDGQHSFSSYDQPVATVNCTFGVGYRL